MWINNNRIPVLLWLLAWFFSLSGCYNGDEQAFRDAVELNELGIIAIEVSPDPLMDPATIDLNETLSYTAYAQTNTSLSLLDISDLVDWSTTDSSVASITQAGIVTGNGVGSVDVSAELAGLAGNKVLAVSIATLNTIEISGSPASVGVCTHGYQLNATGNYSDGARPITGRVNWISSDNSIAKVDSRGIVSTFKEGPVKFTASYKAVTSNELSMVVGLPKLESISVTPASETISVGSQLQFTAKGTYTGAADPSDITKTVKWEATTDTASFLSFSSEQKGLATGVAEGEALVTATCDPTATTPIKSGSVAVTVVKPRTIKDIRILYGDDPSDVLVDLSNTTATTVQLVAKLEYSDGTLDPNPVTNSSKITWLKSDIDGKPATVSNVNGSKGKVSFTGVGRTKIEVIYTGVTSKLEDDIEFIVVE